MKKPDLEHDGITLRVELVDGVTGQIIEITKRFPKIELWSPSTLGHIVAVAYSRMVNDLVDKLFGGGREIEVHGHK